MPGSQPGIFFNIQLIIKMKNVLLLVSREGMGSAPNELQTVLVINFFRTLLKENQIPGTIFFYAEGVKLNLQGSVIEDLLIELENRGTSIITCTTCLNYFDVLPELATGKKGGMPDLIRLIGNSDKVITL
jgi:sulfur relay (sulfurtransferase) complex TusBCD TusD component (DsrE family)